MGQEFSLDVDLEGDVSGTQGSSCRPCGGWYPQVAPHPTPLICWVTNGHKLHYSDVYLLCHLNCENKKFLESQFVKTKSFWSSYTNLHHGARFLSFATRAHESLWRSPSPPFLSHPGDGILDPRAWDLDNPSINPMQLDRGTDTPCWKRSFGSG